MELGQPVLLLQQMEKNMLSRYITVFFAMGRKDSTFSVCPKLYGQNATTSLLVLTDRDCKQWDQTILGIKLLLN
jgi:hypothetical protein